MSCFYSPRTGPLLLFSPLYFTYLITSLSDPLRHSVMLFCWHANCASLLACATFWGFLLSHACHVLVVLPGVVIWHLLRYHLLIFLHLAPRIGGVFVLCLSTPHPQPSAPHTLWHLFRLIAWLVCTSLLSWMDWFYLLLTKSKSCVIQKNTPVQTWTQFEQSNCRGLSPESSLSSNLLKWCY